MASMSDSTTWAAAPRFMYDVNVLLMYDAVDDGVHVRLHDLGGRALSVEAVEVAAAPRQ